jgi:hypothetical protein
MISTPYPYLKAAEAADLGKPYDIEHLEDHDWSLQPMPCGQHQRFRALNQQSSTYAILETLAISGTYLNERVT